MRKKRIAVLTSGGGAPGMNTAIRSLTRKGLYNNLEVFGVFHGYEGMIDGEFVPFDERSVAGIIKEGGSILKIARSDRFDSLAGFTKALGNLKELRIDAVVSIGDNKALANAEKLSAAGVATIAIPATASNDIPGTEYTLGFDTALNTILQAVNKIRDTVSSCDRVAIVEIVGGFSGQLTFMAALASGAEAVLIPERKIDVEALCDNLLKSSQRGKLYSIVLVTEGAADSYAIADEIAARTPFTARVTVLGHTPRGGAPSAMDSITGSHMGALAIDCILADKVNVMIAMRKQELTAVPYGELGSRPGIDPSLEELISILALNEVPSQLEAGDYSHGIYHTI
ncbi:MAG: 6-phosphofructokinase [Firmicutes bacterium]|nr:6-phosphofructokinase [Bacillota bacterium]